MSKAIKDRKKITPCPPYTTEKPKPKQGRPQRYTCKTIISEEFRDEIYGVNIFLFIIIIKFSLMLCCPL